MPGGDRNGPTGLGPVTGRGLGYCTKHVSPGYAYSSLEARSDYGFGFRGRSGRGRRNRNRYWDPAWDGYSDLERSFVTPYHRGRTLQEEWKWLHEEIKRTDEELKEMKKRISELKEQTEYE